MEQLKGFAAFSLFLLIMLPAVLLAQTTGKIAGTVTDKTTGEALPGVNILVIGTNLGAVSDLNGHYTILQVPPGTYDLRISMVGYRQVLVKYVQVKIEQTASVDVVMEAEAIEAAEVVVTAKKNLIEPDVATSVTSITSEQAQRLPAVNAISMLGLQAGVQGGFSGPLGYGGGITIRGSTGNQIKFNVNGVTLRDPRNNLPDEGIPLSSVKDMSLIRGGFSAEYGQVMGGLVNAVTREGGKTAYSGRFEVRMAPPQPKYWLAPGVYDLSNPMSYALRPFFDPAVCWTGTANGNWDYYTQQLYPQFAGWDAISQQLNANGYNLTPTAAQRAFMYEIRKSQLNNQPDYDIDAGFGGPIPVVGPALGDLRFYAAYRGNRTMLVWPLSRPDYRDYTGTIQLNSDITPTMQLELYALQSQTFTEASNWNGPEGYFQSANDVVTNAGNIGQATDLFGLFSNFAFSLADIRTQNVSAKFTHTVNASTYYEVTAQNYAVHYNTGPAAARDTSILYQIVPGFYEDSNPFGYWPYWPTNPTSVLVGGSSFYARIRDYSRVNTTSLKFDLTSQLNFENQIRTGMDVDYTALHFDYGIINSQLGQDVYAARTVMNVYPYRAAAYLQDKLETKEFTMNAGLRLDYSDANLNWWDVNPFDAAFFQPADSASFAATAWPTKPAKMQWFLEPRLAIAHPISENAKLYFNYGWFRQLPTYEAMLLVSRTPLQAVSSIGNPNLTMAKNVAYELGVDFSLSDEWLLQTSAYYKDYSDQQNNPVDPNDQNKLTYISTQGFSYTQLSSFNYSDQKGFEITLSKNGGNWVRGFVDYTYQANSGGHFGSANIYNSASQQLIYDANTENQYQDRTIPAPFARANVDFFTPTDFGPEFLGNHVIGDWMLNVVLDWQAGYWQTYNPNNLLNVGNNVQALDYFNGYLRLQKNITIGMLNFAFFMDVNNFTNNISNSFRYLSGGDQNYLASLHFPSSNAYSNIPGDDKIGDYRKPGAAWQPMEQLAVITQNTSSPSSDKMNGSNSIAIYYNRSTGTYWWYGSHGYANGQAGWWQVPQSKISEVLDDKTYIRMPEESTFWFLDPRTFYFGLTVSFTF